MQYTHIGKHSTKASYTYKYLYKNYCAYTIIWEKFTVGYFRVNIAYGEIFSSLGVSDKKFVNNELF